LSFFKPADDSDIKLFSTMISQIAWLPVIQSPPHPMLPWKQSLQLQPAFQVRQSSEQW
jgi:hypothetical protein